MAKSGMSLSTVSKHLLLLIMNVSRDETIAHDISSGVSVYPINGSLDNNLHRDSLQMALIHGLI